MAKKNLSGAKGVDALFGGVPVKPIAKKVVEKAAPKEVPVKKEINKIENKRTAEPTVRKKVAKAKPIAPVKKAVVEEVSESEEEAQQVFRVSLDGVRKKKVEYTGIRLRQELFERLKTIAGKEKLKSTNSLISIVLEAYCEGYEKGA